MPWTEAQRRKFHAECRKGNREMCRLAKEADRLPVKKPVKKGTMYMAKKKSMPMKSMAGKAATPPKTAAPKTAAPKTAPVAAARKSLQRAISRHERHVSGKEPTTAASQQKLMGEMKAALTALGGGTSGTSKRP